MRAALDSILSDQNWTRTEKFNSPLISVSCRDGTGSGLPESTPARFCVFLSGPDSESKICEKPDPQIESLFHFGSCRTLCGHFLGKNRGKFWLDD